MISHITIENFNSIRDAVSLNMLASREYVERHVHKGSGRRRSHLATRTAVLFGPDGCGKSHILNALELMGRVLAKGAWHSVCADLGSLVAPDGRARPFRLAVEYECDSAGGGNRRPHRYELVLELAAGGVDERLAAINATPCRVVSESLGYTLDGKMYNLFSRADDAVQDSAEFRVGRKNWPMQVSDGPILSTMADHGYRVAARSIAPLRHIFVGYSDNGGDGPEPAATELFGSEAILKGMLVHAQRLKLGVEDVRVEQQDGGGVSVVFFRSNSQKGKRNQMRWDEAPPQVRQFFLLYPNIHHAITKGGVLLWDCAGVCGSHEMMGDIVNWFKNPALNRRGAQLLLSSSCDALMDSLWREEIHVMKKTVGGSGPALYGMGEFPGATPRDNYRSRYIGEGLDRPRDELQKAS